MSTNYPTPDEINEKKRKGLILTAWETSVYRLNFRPNGERYSDDPTIRTAEYDADNVTESERFLLAAKRLRESRGGHPTATMHNGRIVFTYPDGTVTKSGK